MYLKNCPPLRLPLVGPCTVLRVSYVGPRGAPTLWSFAANHSTIRLLATGVSSIGLLYFGLSAVEITASRLTATEGGISNVNGRIVSKPKVLTVQCKCKLYF